MIEVVHIIEIQPLDILQQRFVSLIVLVCAPNAHRANRGAVVGVAKRNDFLSAGVAFGEFERPVRCLRPAVDEENIVQLLRQNFRKSLSEKHLRTLHNLTINGQVHIFVKLFFDSLYYFGMPVSYV